MIKIFHRRHMDVVDRRKGTLDKVVFSVAFLVFLVYALSVIIFFGWAILTSFKGQNEFLYQPLSLPESFRFENYRIALEKFVVNGTNFLGLLWNSIWYSFGSSIIYIFFHLCTSYIFTKFDFKAKKVMYFLIILYMLIPLYGSSAAMYKLIHSINITNSPLYLITFAGGFTGSTFLILSAAWETVDKTYNEAAEVDGASLWQTFIRLMLPMMAGPTLALFIINFIGTWNHYEPFVMYLDKLPNLALGVYLFSEEMVFEANDPVFFAGVTMAMIPILIFFAVFANKIMDSISFGSGIKG